MSTTERADAIIQDILANHLPRIKEALECGYVDENQILVMYDHAVRARILREHAGTQPVQIRRRRFGEPLSPFSEAQPEKARVPGGPLPPFIGPAHTVELAVSMMKKDKAAAEAAMWEKFRELERAEKAKAGAPAAERKVYNYTLNETPVETVWPLMTGSDLRALLPQDKSTHGLFQEAAGELPDIEIADSDSFSVDGKDFYSVPPATFGSPPATMDR